MQNATKMGLNCTGAQMSPLDSEEQLKASQEVPPDIPGNEKKLALVRKEKAAEADAIGSVPIPGTAKGMLKTLQHFRDEEAEHFALVVAAMQRLGADPTAMTPCADVVGVTSMGVLQAISDPRTNLAQSLNALLTAELTDNAGWELLIELAEASNQSEIAQSFEKALAQEQVHLTTVRSWLAEAVLDQV
jgi:hypothetical protein